MSAARMGVRVTLAAVGALVSVALMAAPSWGAAAVTSCTGPLGPGTITGDVSAGAGCHLQPGTTVTGSVSVNPGGSLTTEEYFHKTVVIGGDVKSEGATEIVLENVSLGGNVDLQGTTGLTSIAHGRVNGNVDIQKSCCLIQLGTITVGGNVVMEYNDVEGMNIVGATIRKDVVVEHNTVIATSQLADIEVHESVIEGGVRLNNNSVSRAVGTIGEMFVLAFADHVGKNLEVSNNTVASPGAVGVGDNVVARTLTCEGNEPPPEALQPNTAKKKLGQCELL